MNSEEGREHSSEESRAEEVAAAPEEALVPTTSPTKELSFSPETERRLWLQWLLKQPKALSLWVLYGPLPWMAMILLFGFGMTSYFSSGADAQFVFTVISAMLLLVVMGIFLASPGVVIWSLIHPGLRRQELSKRFGHLHDALDQRFSRTTGSSKEMGPLHRWRGSWGDGQVLRLLVEHDEALCLIRFETQTEALFGKCHFAFPELLGDGPPTNEAAAVQEAHSALSWPIDAGTGYNRPFARHLLDLGLRWRLLRPASSLASKMGAAGRPGLCFATSLNVERDAEAFLAEFDRLVGLVALLSVEPPPSEPEQWRFRDFYGGVSGGDVEKPFSFEGVLSGDWPMPPAKDATSQALSIHPLSFLFQYYPTSEAFLVQFSRAPFAWQELLFGAQFGDHYVGGLPLWSYEGLHFVPQYTGDALPPRLFAHFYPYYIPMRLSRRGARLLAFAENADSNALKWLEALYAPYPCHMILSPLLKQLTEGKSVSVDKQLARLLCRFVGRLPGAAQPQLFGELKACLQVYTTKCLSLPDPSEDDLLVHNVLLLLVASLDAIDAKERLDVIQSVFEGRRCEPFLPQSRHQKACLIGGFQALVLVGDLRAMPLLNTYRRLFLPQDIRQAATHTKALIEEYKASGATPHSGRLSLSTLHPNEGILSQPS